MPRLPRPSTPNFNISHPGDPTSPPQTPTTASPVNNRKSGVPNGRGVPAQISRPMSHFPPSTAGNRPNPNIRPNSIRPDQLSPRSSDSSSEESDSGSSGSGSPPRSLSSDQSDVPVSPAVPHLRAGRTVVNATLIVEELSDFDSDDDHLQVLRPHAIEYADSDRSRSRSRNPPELDRTMLSGMQDLQCGTESDESDLDEAEYTQFLLKQREEKRRKRMNSGSIGKRTISESIGSDTDREDIRAMLDASDVGSSARRLRRRVGDRRSLQFQDPPPPRIDELEEPNTTDDDMMEVGEALARELPYYTLEYISMEVDSP